jgi:hypothetical protein
MPATWARSIPIAPRKAATWSAWPSVEYGPGGLSLSPDPGRSIAMQLKCSVYAGSWNA